MKHEIPEEPLLDILTRRLVQIALVVFILAMLLVIFEVIQWQYFLYQLPGIHE